MQMIRIEDEQDALYSKRGMIPSASSDGVKKHLSAKFDEDFNTKNCIQRNVAEGGQYLMYESQQDDDEEAKQNE